MTIKNQLISVLKNVLEDVGITEIIPTVDYPTDPAHGDYATNVALVAAKKLGKNPRELAEDIVKKFTAHSLQLTVIEKVEIAGPGFINFWIKNEKLMDEIASSPAKPDPRNDAPIVDIGQGRSVVVEYSSPNIAKPFTIGHLRSTIIGDAVANLLEATGWKVYRDNHVGDWGTQFGKQIYAIKAWGNEEEIEKSERPVKLLVDLYVKFHTEAEKDPSLEDKAREWFKKLEDGDEEARKLWQKCIDWSWKEFEAIYQQLGVPSAEHSSFENNGRGYGESFFEDKMKPVLEELEKKGFLKEGKEGAKIVEFPEEIKLPALMILKKDGASLYATRDLATDKFRLGKYGKDVLVINEVGAEQSLYWEQIFQTEYMLGWYKKGQRIHKKHGLYRFKAGKMSTRKGNVIWLEDVLEEVKQKAYGLQKHSSEFEGQEVITTNEKVGESAKKHVLGVADRINVSDAVGIGALKWNDLKRSSEQDITFDWDEILNMQGNSGPYLQYTFARTQSVLAKVQSSQVTVQNLAGDLKLGTEERELLRLLVQFPEIVQEAAERLAPNLLCTYLFDLAQNFNLFYQKCPILKAEGDSRELRLYLTQTTGETLQKGLALLGIKAPEKM